MNKYIRDGLGIAGIILGIALGWAALSHADTYSKAVEPSSFRSFSVSAEGEETAVPDVAAFSFSMITEGGKDLGALQEENTLKVNKAIAFVKSNGVDDKDIKTSGYQVDPRYETSDCYRIYSSNSGTCPPPTIVGYTVTSTVEVKARDFLKVGDLLSGVVDNGANSVSQIGFTIDDLTAVQDKARKKAIAKAMEQATSVSRAAGFRVGRLLSIYESQGYQPYPAYGKSMTEGFGGSDMVTPAAPTIEPGSQKVSTSVTMTYEIK